MKNATAIIALFLFTTCNQTSSEDSQERTSIASRPQKDGIIPTKKSSFPDNLDFSDFETLVKDEEFIPLSAIIKFVNINDSSLYASTSKFIGKGVASEKKYKMFYLKQGYQENGKFILITYDRLNNRQIDAKTFISYCEPCPNEVLESNISFTSNSKNIEIVVQYFRPTTSKVMPIINDPKMVKEEIWTIKPNGFFVLLH